MQRITWRSADFPRRSWLPAWFVLLVAGAVPRALADTAYWRVSSGRVTVISDNSPQRCTHFATELVDLEAALRQLAGWDADTVPPPMTLYALSQQDAAWVLSNSGRRMELDARSQKTFSQYLPERNSNVAVMADDHSKNPLQSTLFLYAQGLMTNWEANQHKPPWFQLGIGGLLNGLVIGKDGSVMLSKEPPFVPKEAGTHSNAIHFDLPRLLAMQPDEFQAGDYGEFMLRARDWAQFGLLTTPERRSQYQRLAGLMEQGDSAEEAVKSAFGAPLEQLAAEFEAGTWRNAVQLHLPPPSAPPVIPEPSRLEPFAASNLLNLLADRVARDSPK